MIMIQHATGRRSLRIPTGIICLLIASTALTGCNSFFNSWFDPSAVGSFTREATLDIRSSLSIQDTPAGIAGATDPRPEDLIPIYEEYRVGPGDVLMVRIFELLARGTETNSQAAVDEIGAINIPVVGQIRVAGMTRTEVEQEIVEQLRTQGIIQDAQVLVDLAVKRRQTFIAFGAGVAPNIYPIPRPNTRLLEALNIAGGLSELATEIYVMREPEDDQFEMISDRRGSRRDAGLEGERGMPAAMLSDGLGGWSAGGGYDEPPTVSDEERAALIDAVVGAESTVKPAPELTTTQTVVEVQEPAAQRPRWIFMNGEWIETTAPPEEPELPPVAVPSGPTVDQPQDDRLAEPERTPFERAAPEAEPQIDWNRLAGERESRVVRVSAQGLRSGDYRQNIVVRAGDRIRVLAGEVGEYYIMGQINRPGSYSLTGRQLTLKTAVAAAGNLSPLAWPTRCTIYRRYGDREEMHQVNLDAIFAGKEPDVRLKNNDLILVGTHPAAPFLAVFRNAFRMTYGFGFVYDRNFGDIDSYGGQINPNNVSSGVGSRFPNLFR